MRIETLAELDMSAADEARIAMLVNGCFGPEFGGNSFHMQRHHVRIVARDPGIVGHMALCFRAVRMGERLVDILGLAEVCTAPERRGEGIASRLMEATMKLAADSRADFLVLFGDQPLYAASGFVKHSNRLRYVEMDGSRTGDVKFERRGGLMVYALGDLTWDPGAEVDLLGNLF